jgi:uncharacterized protein with FMN-binding domain
MIQTIIKIVLAGIAIFLAYVLYQNIMKPVKFNQEVDKRNTAVIQALKDIRAAQLVYKSAKSVYANDLDSLILFVKNGEIPVVKLVPAPTDTTFSKTIRDTIGYVSVIDSLYKRAGFSIDKMKIIPSSTEEFSLEAGKLEKGGVEVNVFEAKAHYDEYLSDLDKQMLMNIIAGREDIERFPGLKVGSMTEVSIDGNWE